MGGQQVMALIATVALAVGVVAGCGDDDADEGASITKEEWIAQANAICTTGDEEMDQAAEEALSEAQESGKPDQQAEQRFLEEAVAPGIEEQVADVAVLPRPRETKRRSRRSSTPDRMAWRP